MRQLIYICFFSCLILQLSAQNNDEKKPSTLVFHLFYNDFNTAQLISSTSFKNVTDNHLWSKLGNMQMGFGLNYLKGITGKIDFVATLDGSSTDYLFKDGTTNGTSEFLLDFNTAFDLKLMTDRHKVNPYLSVGTGISLYRGKPGFYVPVGVGVQFNLFNEAFVFTNLQYRNALSQVVNNHFQYNIGVGASLAKKKRKVLKIAELAVLPEPVKKETVAALPFVPASDIVVTVKDEATGQPLPFVDVVLNGPESKNQTSSTDAEGKVTFTHMAPAGYSVSGILNNIITSAQNIRKSDFGINGNPINVSITHNDPRFTLAGSVVNRTKNMPEGGAEIKVTNDTKQRISTKQSHVGDGSFRIQLEAESDFSVIGKKSGYISNIEKVSTKGLNRSTTLTVKLALGIEEAKVGQSIMLKDINFEMGKSTLNADVSPDLDRLARFLIDNPETKLEIQGHTDNVGSPESNIRLSTARANSVVYYLAKHGIDVRKLSAIGYGPSFPIADNATAKGRAINRRVEMKVVE